MIEPRPVDLAELATVRALAEISRQALACFVRQAGGRLIVPGPQWAKLPDGELTVEFGDDGSLDLIYTQRPAAPADHAAPNLAAPSGRLANHLVCQMAVSLIVAQNGGRLRLTGFDLASNERVGAMRFEPTLDGGWAFYTFEGATH